jgi:hypothetical protein
MATIKSTAAAFANQKLVYASSFANFQAKAAELHPSGTGAVSGEEWKSAQNPFYNSVVYTGDGYVVTHGVAIKAAVDNNAGGDGEVSGVVGVSINGNKLTVSVGDDTASATLPVVALSGNDNIGVTNTSGTWEIKLKEVTVAEEKEAGEGSVEVSEVTVDEYGRVSKVKTVAFDIDKVKVDATKKSGKLIVGEAGTGYLGASDITIDGKNLTVGTLTAEAITLNGEALDSAMSKAHEELEQKVDDEVASLNASISSIESKLTAHENLNASISKKGHV